MEFTHSRTAMVLIGLRNDVLSEFGVNCSAVCDSVVENHTVENIEIFLRLPRRRIMKCSSRHVTFIPRIEPGK